MMITKLSERDDCDAKRALRTVQFELLFAYLLALICAMIAVGAIVLYAAE